jgi:ABC-type multidrug transport system fused ATPase/permease subunit
MPYFYERINKLQKISDLVSPSIIALLLFGSLSSFLLGYLALFFSFALLLTLRELNILSEEISIPSFMLEWFSSLEDVLIFFVSIVLLKALFEFIVIMTTQKVSVVISSRFRINVFFDLLQRNNPKFISAADANFRLSEIAQKATEFTNQGAFVLNYAIQSFTLCCIMFYLTWEISLAALGLLSLLSFFLLKINRTIQAVAKKVPAVALSINKGIERIARNWLLVYILRTNNKEYENMVNNELYYRSLVLRITIYNFMNSAFPMTFGTLLILAIIYLNIEYVQIGSGVFLSFLYLFLKFVQSLANTNQYFGKLISNIPQFKIAFSNFVKLSADEREACVAPTKLLSWHKMAPIYRNEKHISIQTLDKVLSPPQLVFENVCFTYEKSLESVLENINLKIEPGQQIGIIGRSGSGKSTLLGLILGILQPTSGKVLINDQSSREYFKNHKIKIGYVGAEPFLMEGTIKDNLNYGHFDEGEITNKQYDQALLISELYKVVETLPGKMGYKLLENGDGLSAGQKQRLALARALLIFPKLLILDEVSANLDEKTELEIAKSIQYLKGKCTVVIVSHKPGILQFSDTVIDLEQINH